jgi:hypothetical protein
MVADSARALAILALVNSNDVDPFEMAAGCHPSNLNFVLYCVSDVNADEHGDDAGDGVAKHSSMHHALDCRNGIDMFLY